MPRNCCHSTKVPVPNLIMNMNLTTYKNSNQLHPANRQFPEDRGNKRVKSKCI